MSLLADTQRGSPGRWVLMPRRRFLDPTDRARARLLRRRRVVFTTLLEAIGLFLLMGVVPPFRVMLLVAGGLALLLLLYSAILVQIKSMEFQRARRRARAAQLRSPTDGAGGNGRAVVASSAVAGSARHVAGDPSAFVQVSSDLSFHRTNGHRASAVAASGNGHASTNGRVSTNGRASTNGHGSGIRYASAPNGRSNGGLHSDGNGRDPEVADGLDVALIQLLDDDVHVVIRRAAELEPEGSSEAVAPQLRSASGR